MDLQEHQFGSYFGILSLNNKIFALSVRFHATQHCKACSDGLQLTRSQMMSFPRVTVEVGVRIRARDKVKIRVRASVRVAMGLS